MNGLIRDLMDTAGVTSVACSCHEGSTFEISKELNCRCPEDLVRQLATYANGILDVIEAIERSTPYGKEHTSI